MEEVPTAEMLDIPAEPNQLLIEWLGDLQQRVTSIVTSLSEEQLHWRPHPDANNVSVTVWHFSRWLDVVGRIWHSDDHRDELWWAEGWAQRTGYDPAGLGMLGVGALTGYTPAEMRAVPPLNADTLVAYHQRCVQHLTGLLEAATPETLAEPARGLGGQNSRYAWTKTVLQGSFGHLGEIEALIALHPRETI